MKLKYSIFYIFFLLLCICPSYAIKSKHGLDGFNENIIDATKNARLHSNLGNIYFDEKHYFAALKEYEIAYNLVPNSQSSGTYLYNIARCFMTLKNYPLAQNAILGAIKKDCINITYYNLLVDSIIMQKHVDSELKQYINDTKNPYNRIVVGLIYLKTGRTLEAKATFDDFVSKNPNMIISNDIKTLLNQI